MLDYRLYTFIQLCETKNYTKTAEILNITQPAVSQHIRYLENQYQTKLVHYDGRKVHLTPHGQILYNYANSVLINSNLIKEQFLSPSVSLPRLRIGSMPTTGAELLPNIISEFLKDHQTNISLHYSNSTELLKLLKAGEIDIAIVDNSLPLKDFTSKFLFHDHTICICSPEHPLAGKEVYMQELYKERLLLSHTNSSYNKNLDKMLQKSNFSLSSFTNYLELGHVTAIKKQLFCMESIALIYGKIFQSELRNGQLKEIFVKDFHSSHETYLCYIKDHLLSETFEEFYQCCLECLR